jgi:hypothetical protein
LYRSECDEVIIDWKLRRIGDQASWLKYSTILTFIIVEPRSKPDGILTLMVEAFMSPVSSAKKYGETAMK